MSSKLLSTSSVLAVPDVAVAAKWFGDVLGFKPDFFPDEQPYAFCILCRDAVEVMLRCAPVATRDENDWDLYVRTEGVESLLADVTKRGAKVVEPINDKPYRCREFAVEDPHGYRIVFSQSL